MFCPDLVVHLGSTAILPPSKPQTLAMTPYVERRQTDCMMTYWFMVLFVLLVKLLVNRGVKILVVLLLSKLILLIWLQETFDCVEWNCWDLACCCIAAHWTFSPHLHQMLLSLINTRWATLKLICVFYLYKCFYMFCSVCTLTGATWPQSTIKWSHSPVCGWIAQCMNLYPDLTCIWF